MSAAAGCDHHALEEYPGEQLRALRESLNVSQRALAGAAGVHQADVSRLERGAGARWTTLKRLVNALGCDVALVPCDQDDAEGFLKEEAERRKDRMEAGRQSRW